MGGDDREKLSCPRCGRVWWSDPDVVLGYRCPSCGGEHLPARSVEELLIHEGGWTIESLRAAAKEPEEAQGGCAACGAPMGRVDVNGVPVDLCTRCGGAWLDPGELEEISAGKHRERRPPGELARRYLPDAIDPGGKRGRVFVGAGSALTPVGCFTLLLLVPVSCVFAAGAILPNGWGAVQWLLLPIASLMVGVGLVRRQNGVFLDLEQRRLAVARPFGLREWVAFDALVDVRVWRSAAATALPHFAVELRADKGVALARLFVVNRLEAHRLAFSLSQLLGVPVSTLAIDRARTQGDDDQT